MLIPEERQTLKNQQAIKRACQKAVFDFLDSAKDTLNHFFPAADLVLPGEGPSKLEAAITKKSEVLKQWISEIFDTAIQISIDDEYQEIPIEAAHSIPIISQRIFHALLRILSGNRNLTDNALLFLDAVGRALEMEAASIDISIEQMQYERRKEFTQRLIDNHTEEQCSWVAHLLWTAIHIDEKVDYREYKYLENIMHLINFDQKVLYLLDKGNGKPLLPPPLPFIDPQFCIQIYRYITEIVMIDEKFSPEEAAFIQEVGRLLEYDKAQQDDIIQPIISALMLRKFLFPS